MRANLMRDLKPSPQDVRFGRWLVVFNGAIPAALLLADAIRGKLGANPANFAIRSTGFCALISIVACLAVTPALRLTGQRWLGNFRRALGLYAFWYALAHFTLFFWLDRQLSVSSTVHEMWARKYLLVGATGLIVMVPLAVTSTNAMIRRLGPARWKRLHRLAYVAGIAGVAHYYMLQKADVRLPIVYACVLGALLASRLVWHYLDLRRAARMASDPARAVAARPAFFRGKLRVIATFDEAPGVRTFRLAAIEPNAPLPFDYKAGQYLNLSLAIDGRRVNRSYTIASAPTRAGHCELTVKREAAGTSSVYLHDTVKVGDELDVSAPAGKFTFDSAGGATSVVMIAGGVGVTPLMSKLRDLTDRAWPGDIYFVFSARAKADLIFREELERLARRHRNLKLIFTLTRPDDAWRGERGRMSKELLARAVPDLPSRPVHVCGPDAMAAEVHAMLVALGVPENWIAMESFTSAKNDAAIDATPRALVDVAAQQLTFSTSGKTVEVPAGQTILEAAEAADVAINFDCRSGICGTCKVRLNAGEVAMDAEDALSVGDRAQRLILACQARCLSAIEIEA